MPLNTDMHDKTHVTPWSCFHCRRFSTTELCSTKYRPLLSKGNTQLSSHGEHEKSNGIAVKRNEERTKTVTLKDRAS